MDEIVIHGGKKLNGTINICSSKNAFLPILAGSIMCDGQVVLKDYPHFEDIQIMCEILNAIGIDKKTKDNDLYLNCQNANGYEIPKEQTKLIRSSIFSLGSVLGRFRKAKVAYPGGCAIGARPIDLHIKGLRELNVKIEEEDGFLICDGKDMRAGNVHFDFPSVGATENVMLAATLTKGISKISNCAKEPEIVDLQNFLNLAGAKISGAGTDEIVVEGVKKLHGVNYKTIPDRIIAGTVLIASAMAGGKVEIENVIPEHIESLIKIINKYCCNITVFDDKIIVQANGKPNSFGKIETNPYPNFPTDLQPQIIALGSVCKGKSEVVENVFETRFKHITELEKMGAKIRADGKTAFITGVKNLVGTDVYSADLRGGAALTLAGLCAHGETTVHEVQHIDRGYDHIENMFSSLGADIKRIKIE